ncbi:MAG: PAS domain-containing protein, partial [Nitrospinota bacterium]
MGLEYLDTKEFLTNLMKSLPDAIFTIKLPERQIEYVNQAIYTMFGYTPEEVIGKTTRIFYPDEFSYASFGQKLQTAIARGE